MEERDIDLLNETWTRVGMAQQAAESYEAQRALYLARCVLYDQLKRIEEENGEIAEYSASKKWGYEV